MLSESVPQTNYSELRSWTCAPSAHPKMVFLEPSRFSKDLTMFAEWAKHHM